MSGGNIRIKDEDRDRLKRMMAMREVRELAARQGVIDDPTDAMTFEKVMLLVIPNDADPISRPEDEMCWQNAGDAKDEILELAGENVSIHEVVTHLVNQFADEHDLSNETAPQVSHV